MLLLLPLLKVVMQSCSMQQHLQSARHLQR
jgi:hypothetical protein